MTVPVSDFSRLTIDTPNSIFFFLMSVGAASRTLGPDYAHDVMESGGVRLDNSITARAN